MKGIKAVIGVYKTKGLKGGTTEVQSVLIPIKFPYSEAKKWLKRHGFKYGYIDEGKSYWRARQIDPEEFVRMRTISFNPGATWHRLEQERWHKEMDKVGDTASGIYCSGRRDAHRYSVDMSERMGMNPTKGKKWYVGIIGSGYGEIFISVSIPTHASHGDKYKYAFGPYNTRRKAVEVANYQNIKIKHSENPCLGLHLHSEDLKNLRMNPQIKSQIVDKIYDKILAIEAKKGKDSLWPNENFRHDFKDGAEVFGLKDGSLLIKGRRGKKLWKRINYD